MSKADILQEIPKLNPEERTEILDLLWQLAEQDVLNGVQPTAAEQALLDREWAEYQDSPNDGSTWAEVKLRLPRAE